MADPDDLVDRLAIHVHDHNHWKASGHQHPAGGNRKHKTRDYDAGWAPREHLEQHFFFAFGGLVRHANDWLKRRVVQNL